MNKKVAGCLFAILIIAVIVVIVVCLIGKYGFKDQAYTPFWKETVVYQIYPRSILDQDMDGTGDLAGITAKANYFVELGIGTVWLSPIFTSPMADFGYDISNYIDIDPIFGDLADFDALVRALHGRGIRVVMDFVPNHSSDEHEWFQRSIKKEDPYTDYYIWADPKGTNETGDPIPPNNWLSVFRGSAWTWVEERKQFYFHQFLDKQPDLNFRNPDVKTEMEKVLKFWLDRGVDGFRVDAIKHLFEVKDINQDEPVAFPPTTDNPEDYDYLNHTLTVNQPETLQVVREWRELLDKYADKVMMAEVYDGDIEVVMAYYGNTTEPIADFPFNFILIDNLKNRSELTGETLKATIDVWLDNMPEGKWPNWVLGNHDNNRIGSRLGADMVDALNMMNLLLPGTPVTYNGEEIGMVDTFVSWEDTKDPQGCRYGPDRYQEFSRDPERTPMQWDDSKFAGFTKGNSTWLPVNENYKTLNVKSQRDATESHLKVYQKLAQLRKEEVFTKGHIAFPVITKEIFSFLRYLQDFTKSYLLVMNTAEEEVEVDLHHHANVELPKTGIVVLRSVTDTREETSLGSELSLANMNLLAGEALLLDLSPGEEEET